MDSWARDRRLMCRTYRAWKPVAVEGALPDEVEGPPVEGVDLVADEDVPRTGEGEEELAVVVEVEPAHVPGLVVVQLQVKFHVCQWKNRPFEPNFCPWPAGRLPGGFPIIPRQVQICKLYAKLQIDQLRDLW